MKGNMKRSREEAGKEEERGREKGKRRGTHHIRRNEHPLWQRAIDDIVRKVVEGADAFHALRVLRDCVVDDQRIVLADVVRVGL
jgi:hypothetical protein